MSLAPTPTARSRAPLFVLCWLCLMADGYDLLAYGATLPSLIGQPPFSLTVEQGGHIGSLALAGMLAGSLVAGTLTDVVGRRRIFISSVALFSAGTLVTGLAPTLEVFVVFRTLTCVGVGGLLPTAVALASEFAHPRNRSRTLGLVLTGPPLGMLLASSVASQVVPVHGFRPVYVAGGAVLLLVPVLVKLQPESPAFHAARGRHELAAALRSRYGLPPEQVPATAPGAAGGRNPLRSLLSGRDRWPTLLIWGTTFFSLLTVFGISTWLPQVMARSGYGLGSSIVLLGVYCTGAVVGTLAASAVADRVGPKPLVLTGYLTAAAALLAISLRPPTPLLVVLVLLAGFGGLGTQNVLNDLVSRYYPAAHRASGLGWALGVGRLGAIVGPTFGAWAVAGDEPLSATTTAFAATALAGALVVLFVPAQRRAPEGPAVAAAGPREPLSATGGAS
ncbi:MFS transporter [Kineococcus sp. SYSU DK018]|uniref:MFS transporter n=1 Tax=Kineococcus sp. SYSU DK018 TaxID=3383139 RepID=UPI003D7D3285